MMLRYGRALVVSRIANQLLANQSKPREPAHALPKWHRSGRAALNAAGGQVRTSKFATAFGKLPVSAENLRSRSRQRRLTTSGATNRRHPGSKGRQCHPFVCSRDDSALVRRPLRARASAELRGRRAADWPSVEKARRRMTLNVLEAIRAKVRSTERRLGCPSTSARQRALAEHLWLPRRRRAAIRVHGVRAIRTHSVNDAGPVQSERQRWRRSVAGRWMPARTRSSPLTPWSSRSARPVVS
jgi:hypothetical protein